MIKQLLIVFCFGGLGSVCRYLLGVLLPFKPISWGVFLSNVLGCLLIGFAIQLIHAKQLTDITKLAITIGFCGGFTTFSSLSADLVLLFQQQKWMLGLAYIVASISTGIISVLLGMYLAKQF